MIESSLPFDEGQAEAACSLMAEVKGCPEVLEEEEVLDVLVVEELLEDEVELLLLVEELPPKCVHKFMLQV